MSSTNYFVSTNGNAQEWRPELIMNSSRESEFLRRVAEEIRDENHNRLVDEYLIERNKDWTELSCQVVGAESI